ncbi:MAG: glycosyltransferase family 39 protein [Cyanobacteria bacterium J06638_22]
MTDQFPRKLISAWGSPCLVFVALALIYGVGASRPATFDELYHVLAAQGWLEHGEPVIADGTYERARWFTWIVSQSFRLFGESLTVARIPTILPMALLGALLFVWMRSIVGLSSAWITTVLYSLSPFAVEIAVFIRFYGLQCLAFFIAATLLYRVIHGSDRWGWIGVQLLLAVAALGVASYFQITTLIGILGLGFWFGAYIVIRWLNLGTIPHSWKISSIIFLFFSILTVLIFAFISGLVSDFVTQYRITPYFNQERANEFWFYHYWIGLYYPSLWPLFPVLTLVAFAKHPKTVLFAAAVFGTALTIHSFAASKSLRYMAYAMPFLFIIMGTGLAEIWLRLVMGLRSLDDGLRAQIPWAVGTSGKFLSRGLIALTLLFLCLANTGSVRSALFIAGITLPPEKPNEQWEQAADILVPELQAVDLIITANETETLYYLGDFDLIWGASRLSELHGAQEFSFDPRTGRRIISTAESLEELQACYPNGIFITSTRRWDDVHFAETEIPFREALLATSEPIDLPPDSRIMAYSWTLSGTSTGFEDCQRMKTLLSEPL